MRNKYILMRHGETRYQAEKLDLLYPEDGNPELPLTENGKKEIEEKAKELKDLGIDLIYCSTYYRTMQTAELVNRELEVDIIFDERLIDTNFGSFSGEPQKKYRSFFKDMKERFTKRPPGGESYNDVKKRVVKAIKDIEKKHKGKTILIISHGDPVWVMAGYLKNLTEDEMIAKRNPQGFCPEVGQYYEL